MSTTPAIEKLKQDQKKIEESLKGLENQKREVEEKYTSVSDEENKILGEMRQCRDAYQYSQLEIRLHPVSRRRREIETRKQAVERKIRGYQEELAKIKARIEYLRPKGKLVPHKEEEI
jgi:predicted  nucleic acid-binding Zn-ribbon protein